MLRKGSGNGRRGQGGGYSESRMLSLFSSPLNAGENQGCHVTQVGHLGDQVDGETSKEDRKTRLEEKD